MPVEGDTWGILMIYVLTMHWGVGGHGGCNCSPLMSQSAATVSETLRVSKGEGTSSADLGGNSNFADESF